MRKILVIDNKDSFVYNLVQLLKNSAGCSFEVVQNDRVDFGTLSRFSRILLSPGPGIPSEAGEMMELLADCKNSHSILGVCLGHQGIAELCGGQLFQLPYPRHGHESILKITDPGDPLLAGINSGIRIGRYHSWVVDPLFFPSELQISSVDEDGNIMSFYHKSLPLFGLQFHPESVISQSGQQIINNWLLK